MSKSVNVDFVTRQIEVDTDGKEYYVSAAVAAKDAEQSMINAQNAANAAEAVAPEYAKTKAVLDNIVSYTNTATEKADIATAQADLATTQATNAANSATNAAQSYANVDAIAGQLTEYLNTKEELTAPAVDKTLLIEGAAADSKVVGALKSALYDLNDKTDFIMPIQKSIGVNKFDITQKVFGELNVDDGSLTDGVYTCTPFIDLTGNTGYVTAYQCNNSKSPEYSYWKYCFYDYLKSFISSSWDPTGNANLSNSTVEVPSNAKYVRFQFLAGSSKQYYMVTFDDSTVHKNNYIDYEETNRKNVNQLEDEVDNHEARIADLEITGANKWEGKNILVLGDSISDRRYHHVEIPAWDKWAEVLSSKLGFTLINDSLHASGFLVNEGSKEIGPRSLINRISNHSGETYDMVILFMGINDAINNMPIGTEPTDDKTVDFYSAVDYCFNYIKNNFTSARFLVLLPLEAKPNWHAANQQAYINVLKEECEKYNIPYLDLYKQSGFDAKNDNFRNMFTELGGSNGNYGPDGLHPNQLWDNNYLAPQIEAFINMFI